MLREHIKGKIRSAWTSQARLCREGTFKLGIAKDIYSLGDESCKRCAMQRKQSEPKVWKHLFCLGKSKYSNALEKAARGEIQGRLGLGYEGPIRLAKDLQLFLVVGATEGLKLGDSGQGGWSKETILWFCKDHPLTRPAKCRNWKDGQRAGVKDEEIRKPKWIFNQKTMFFLRQQKSELTEKAGFNH